MIYTISLLVLFFAVTIYVGLYFRKRARNVNDFVLGGRNVGMWLTAFAYGTTYFSAVVFVGFAGQFGWRFGTSAVWIGLGNAFIGSLLAWIILGRRTRIMTNHLKSATMPDFFGKRYGSSGLKIGAAMIVFIFLVPYTASLYNGLSRLFTVAFGFTDPVTGFIYCVVAMAILTGIFVVAGGYFATAVNDFIQGIVMLVGIVGVIAAVFARNGGFSRAIDALARITETNAAGIDSAPGVFTSFFGPDPIGLLGVVFLTSLGTWGLPQMIARFYSIKSEKMISKGAIISTIFAVIISGGCYFIGSFGRLYEGAENIAFNEGGKIVFDSIVPAMVSEFSPFMIGVVILLVFAASISTLSALVMTSASTLTLDFLKGHVVKNMNDKKQLLIIRSLILVFIAVSSLMAIWVYKGGITFIAQLMSISWGALAGSFLAPFLYGLYWKRTTKISVWCSFIFSTGLMTLNVFFRDAFPTILKSPVNAGAFAMLAGLLIVPLVSAITRAPEKKAVENCFDCFDEKVTVSVKDDLGN